MICDDIICSSQTGVLKSEDPQAFFGPWLAAHGVGFTDAVLIDDRADNCAAFTREGGAAFQWKMGTNDLSDVTDQLRQWLNHDAGYVLLNPLSSMGRGVKARGRLAATEERMRNIYRLTAPFEGADLDVVHIRFPSTGSKPLAGCQAGTIIYVFTPGEVTVCQYLVFAARTPQSQHDPAEFIVGNIFTDPGIAARLDAYHFERRYPMGASPTCGSCGMAGSCGKGCPAAVISAGQRIGAVDAEVCPVTSGERRLLPLMPA